MTKTIYTLPCTYCYGTGIRKEYDYHDNGVCYKCDGTGRKKTTKKMFEEFQTKEASLQITVQSIENEEQRNKVYEALKQRASFLLYDEDGNPFKNDMADHASRQLKGCTEYGFFVSLNNCFHHLVKTLFNEKNEIIGLQIIDKIQIKKLPTFL